MCVPGWPSDDAMLERSEGSDDVLMALLPYEATRRKDDVLGCDGSARTEPLLIDAGITDLDHARRHALEE